jgi:outer membrane immunogenic protein
MRRFALACLASTACTVIAINVAAAADLRTPAYRAPAAAPIYDWTGLYAGVNYGSGISQSRASDPSGVRGGSIDHTGDGYSIGGTIGYNWQVSPIWVIGVEGDFGYFGINRSQLDWGDPIQSGVKTSWIGTLRGRLAYSTGPSLIYITGGGAWVRTEDSLTNFVTGTTVTGTETRGGWTLGGGMETVIGGNWTNKTEYAYVDLGRGPTVTNGAFTVGFDRHAFHIFKNGMNYKFGGPTPAAAPAFNWNGFYMGLNAGIGIAQVRASDPTGTTLGELGNNGSGFTGGVQAGYNVMFPAFGRNVVAGIEGDFGYLGIDRSYTNYNSTAAFGIKTDWLGTVRGRIGVSTGPALLYFTGGAAWVHTEDSWRATAAAPVVTGSTTKTGFALGSGIETALAGNWTTKAEYLYIDVGSGNTLTSGVPSMRVDKHRFHTFRWGLNYKFSGL